MKAVTHPVLKDVVLVGAGHSRVTVLRMFGMKSTPGVGPLNPLRLAGVIDRPCGGSRKGTA